MNAGMVLKNQLPFRFGVDSLNYRIYISGVKVAQSTYRMPFFLERLDTSLVTLPVSLFGETLDSVLTLSEQKGLDSVEYKVESSFYTNLLVKKHFETTVKKRLPLVHIPKIDIKRVELDSLRLNKVVVLVHAFVGNKNVFPIKVKDLSYRFNLEENKWVDGKLPGVTNIAEDSETPLILPVRVSLEDAGETAFNLLAKGKTTDYKMEMDFRVESENNMIHDSKVIVKNEGSLGEVLDFVKKK